MDDKKLEVADKEGVTEEEGRNEEVNSGESEPVPAEKEAVSVTPLGKSADKKVRLLKDNGKG